jgi:peptidoglycan/xylan/chitin deacetylase (PgdA/CDA1 family)
VDEAVAAHPELSADGAKGLLAVTGYEGLFGEHDLSGPAARARVKVLAAALRSDGWVLASHTYGHINLSEDSPAVVSRDIERWSQVTADLLGPVNILVYPFGARPTLMSRRLLRDAGFTIQYDIDVRPWRAVDDGVVMMSRRHVDGFAFADPPAMAPFFSAVEVRDPRRPRR